MRIEVGWSADVLVKFPELMICVGVIIGTCPQEENEQLRQLKKTVYQGVREKYSVETLKDDPVVRAYRDFYWKLDIDPTKTRPSGEALLRRVLNGNELPTISTVVDAYNLASMQTLIPISGFDEDRLKPPLHVRFAESETFTGIGMDRPMLLTKKMLILADKEKVLCIYPYRDSEKTKITMQTRNAVIIGYGAPGVRIDYLREVVDRTLKYVRHISGGTAESVRVFGKS